MKSFLLLCITALFIGCASNQGPEYDAQDYHRIKTYLTGTVIEDGNKVAQVDRIVPQQ